MEQSRIIPLIDKLRDLYYKGHRLREMGNREHLTSGQIQSIKIGRKQWQDQVKGTASKLKSYLECKITTVTFEFDGHIDTGEFVNLTWGDIRYYYKFLEETIGKGPIKIISMEDRYTEANKIPF